MTVLFWVRERLPHVAAVAEGRVWIVYVFGIAGVVCAVCVIVVCGKIHER